MPFRTALIVSLLFLFSGATALVYQVAWTRNLSLIFGASHQAVSIVLAAFMAGLALGGWCWGRVAARLRHPLRTYGVLEFGVAAAGLVLPVALSLVDRAYGTWALQRDGVDWLLNVARAALAFLLLLVPTFFMGGTLPVLARTVVRDLGHFGSRLAWLYGINTCGAVLGTVAAGFLLLPSLGVLRTQLLAVGVNLVIGAVALSVDRRLRHTAQTPSTGRSPASVAPHGPPFPWALRLAFWGTLVSGFVALALEVMWTRAISIAIGTNTYSFTIMLAAFLVGITLGSTLHALLPLRRLHEGFHLGLVLVLIGITSAAVSQLVPRLPEVAVELNVRFHGGSQGMRPTSTLLLSFLVMLVPAILMGIAFPLAGRARARLQQGFGRSVGDLIGLNTLGGILGPLAAGFLLIPALGLQKGMLLVCGLDLGYGLLLLAFTMGSRFRRWLPVAGLVGACGLLLGLALPWLLPRWDLHLLGAFQNNVTLGYTNEAGEIDIRGQLAGTQVLYYREGRSSTVSVTEAQQFRAVLINGKSVATDQHSDLHHEYMLGHLPVLLHREPRSVLVIGLGAGLTLGGVTAHAGVREVTLVEIEPAVLGAARIFEDLNGHALDDPRLRTVIQDGRNFLRTSPHQYDVITADPIHPWSYGAAYLFTTEYYALAREHLAEGGIMCQWVPLYELSLDNLRSIANSFARHFDTNLLFQTAFDAILIGSNGPLQIDLADLARKLAQPRVAAQLGRIGLEQPLSLLAELTMDDEALRAFAATGPLNSDDNLYLEFSSPLSIGTPDGGGNIATIDSHRTDPAAVVGSWGTASPNAAMEQLEAFVRAKRLTVLVTPDIEHASIQPSAALWKSIVVELETLRAQVPDYGRVRVLLSEAYVGRGRVERSQGDLRAAEASFRAAVAVSPRDEHALFHLAATLMDEARAAEALPLLQTVRTQRSRYPHVEEAMGQALLMLGRDNQAIAALHRATQFQPQNASVRLQLAVALTRTSQLDRAVEQFEQAIAIDPQLVEAWFNLALVQGARGDREAAIAAGQRTAELARQRNDTEMLAKISAHLQRFETTTP